VKIRRRRRRRRRRGNEGEDEELGNTVLAFLRNVIFHHSWVRPGVISHTKLFLG
jgi:hypothetical protein